MRETSVTIRPSLPVDGLVDLDRVVTGMMNVEMTIMIKVRPVLRMNRKEGP